MYLQLINQELMNVGENALRAAETRQNPQAGIIKKGVRNSEKRLELLKNGRSLSKALVREPGPYDLIGSEGMKGSLIRDSESNSIYRPPEIETSHREMSQTYMDGLKMRLEGHKHSFLNNKSNEGMLSPSVRMKKNPVIRISNSFESKHKTEREIMKESLNRFDHVKDLNMKSLLINSHAATLRLHYFESLQKRLDQVQEVRSQLFLSRSKDKPASPLNLRKERRPRPRSNIVMQWHSTLMSSSVVGPNVLKRIGDQLAQIATHKDTGCESKYQSEASKSLFDHKKKHLNLEIADDMGKTSSRFYRRASRGHHLQKNETHKHVPKKVKTNSLNQLFKPKTKLHESHQKYEITKTASGREYKIRNLEKEVIKKAVKELVHSKKTDNERISRLIGA